MDVETGSSGGGGGGGDYGGSGEGGYGGQQQAALLVLLTDHPQPAHQPAGLTPVTPEVHSFIAFHVGVKDHRILIPGLLCASGLLWRRWWGLRQRSAGV
jgi:hypothetical protein